MSLNVTDIPKFSAALKKRRQGLRFSPTDVAKEVGVTLGNYCNIEEGRHLPSLVLYKRICRVLRVSPGKLLQK